MDLSQLAAKPVPTKITIKDEAIIKDYSPDGTPLEFYVLDRQPLAVYLKLTAALTVPADATPEQTEAITVARINAISDLILNADGTKMLGNGKEFPVPVAVAAYTEVMNNLGK